MLDGSLRDLEKLIGYEFKDKELLLLALTHSSYSHELMITGGEKRNNERLEFLGDAVLELVSSEFLFRNYTHLPEGELSKLRASLVSETPLADCARQISLDKYVLVGKGEKLNHGNEKDSILSDAFESIIGATYLDGGLEPARAFVESYVLNDIEHKKRFYDAKTELQVMVQNLYQCVPEYEVISESGSPHDMTFTVEVRICGKPYGTGEGRSKKQAQQKAAYAAIVKMEKEKEQKDE